MRMPRVELGGHAYAVGGGPVEVRAALRSLLARLTLLNLEFLRSAAGARAPRLYESGIRYQREDHGEEKWQSIPELLVSRRGDCEDLACALAAELRVRDGIQARAVATGKRLGDHVLYHVIVKYPDGTTEDPSRRLGMR